MHWKNIQSQHCPELRAYFHTQMSIDVIESAPLSRSRSSPCILASEVSFGKQWTQRMRRLTATVVLGKCSRRIRIIVQHDAAIRRHIFTCRTCLPTVRMCSGVWLIREVYLFRPRHLRRLRWVLVVPRWSTQTRYVRSSSFWYTLSAKELGCKAGDALCDGPDRLNGEAAGRLYRNCISRLLQCHRKQAFARLWRKSRGRIGRRGRILPEDVA